MSTERTWWQALAAEIADQAAPFLSILVILVVLAAISVLSKAMGWM